MFDVENALYADLRLVDVYDLLNSENWDYVFYADQMGKQLRKVLDLGCGIGTLALRLAAVGHKVIAVDSGMRSVAMSGNRPAIMKLPVPTVNVPSASQYSGAREPGWVVEFIVCPAYAASTSLL
jgi:methylase of polypeptide subunit release factors